tara:strand:- start:5934 stop:6095 length:162 start_codon:yes stop_codon:yes gene_type:complete
MGNTFTDEASVLKICDMMLGLIQAALHTRSNASWLPRKISIVTQKGPAFFDLT